MIRDRKGIILITVYLVIIVLLILGGAFITRSIWEMRTADRGKEFEQAFYVAECGLCRGKS